MARLLAPDAYELLDFGDGRKLERFGGLLIDRPCPAAAELRRTRLADWSRAAAQFSRSDQSGWSWSNARPTDWSLAVDVPVKTTSRQILVTLRDTETGQVGVFPEQEANWHFVAELAQHAVPPLRVLNMFAYTGATTLVAAAAGAEVTHVDAARNAVTWARANAAKSGLEAAPIRWIVDDARAYARRERRRGRTYDLVVLDPPSYGHGTSGDAWQLDRDLPALFADCWALLSERSRGGLLVSCHTTGVSADDLIAMLRAANPSACQGRFDQINMDLVTTDGRHLPSGVTVRFVPRSTAS